MSFEIDIDDPAVKKIVEFAISELNQKYGFCGAAISKDSAFLNSSDRKGNEIILKINIEKT